MSKKTIIIAEIGVNHNGSLKLAKEHIVEASKAGADFVKFQLFQSDQLSTINAKKADYQINSSKKEETQLQMLKGLELSNSSFLELRDFANRNNLGFCASAFNETGLNFLKKINVDFIKIPSGEITNYPFLKKVSKSKIPLVLSTGMSNLNEIKTSLELLKVSKSKLTLLQCNSSYPTPFCDANLKVINSLREIFKVEVGFSDHTLGIEASIAAVALGASMIEKHFTLDKTLDGPDHKASIEPEEFKEMCSSIRNIEIALGDGIKKCNHSEIKNKTIVRRSIVAKTDIKKGDKLTSKNITTKRPGTGISPMNWEIVLNTKAIKNFRKDEFIKL